MKPEKHRLEKTMFWPSVRSSTILSPWLAGLVLSDQAVWYEEKSVSISGVNTR